MKAFIDRWWKKVIRTKGHGFAYGLKSEGEFVLKPWGVVSFIGILGISGIVVVSRS